MVNHSLWSLTVTSRKCSEKIICQELFFPLEFSLSRLWYVAQQAPGQEMKGQWFYWSLSHLLSITFIQGWRILVIPAAEVTQLSIKCGIPIGVFCLVMIASSFCVFAVLFSSPLLNVFLYNPKFYLSAEKHTRSVFG